MLEFFEELLHQLFDRNSPWGTIIFATVVAVSLLTLIFRRKISANAWIVVGVITQALIFLIILYTICIAFLAGEGGYIFIVMLTFPALCIWIILSILQFFIAKNRHRKNLSVPFSFLIRASATIAFLFLIGAVLAIFIGYGFLIF